MSVYARENLFDFDRFAYGSAASTMLFFVIALITITFIRITRMNLEGED
jgi:trehalose/maltose transport system permease protein